jgi:magnesium transporter
LFKLVNKKLKRVFRNESIPRRPSLAERKFGLPPGSIVNLHDAETQETELTVITYSEGIFSEEKADSIEKVLVGRDASKVTWINVEGFKNISIFETIADFLQIDRLVLEDILDQQSRPKFEEYEAYCFVTAKMLHFEKAYGVIFHEQISFVLHGNLLITFQQKEGDVFEKIRERIRKPGGKIRQRRADYLLYALLDIMVDNYFVVLEKYEENVRNLEDDILENPERFALSEIRRFRHENVLIRQALVPLREAAGTMLRSEMKVFEPSTRKFVRELYEHVVQVNEAAEITRELATSLMETYLSALNTKMGNVNKALTVIATIFLPLTFITGIYGMNFTVLPGAQHPSGFWFIVGFMCCLFTGMLVYFRFKKWF